MGRDIVRFENVKLGAEIRVIDFEGEPWFVARDICLALGIANTSDAVSRLDNDEKNTIVLNDGTPGNPDKAIVSESGLYNLILRSDKPEAKEFRRWVTHDVLPSIRKHGAYMTPHTIESMLSDPRAYAELLMNLANERERRETLENREAIFGNRTPFGFPSQVNGRPRTEPVRGYLRTTKTTVIEEISEYQKRLFDWK